MAINGTCEATPTRPQNSYPISARGLEGFNIKRGQIFWISIGWRHPWVCAAVSGCGTSSPPPMNSRVPCDSAVAKSTHCQYSHACLNGWRRPWVCAAVSGCGASSPPPLNLRVPCDSAMASPVLKRLSQTVGATHGFAPQSPDAARAFPPPMNSRVPCDSAMAKSTHCQYSYACLNRLAPFMGLRRSLRMRRELSAAYEFTRPVRFSCGKIPALPFVSNGLRYSRVCAAVFDLEHDGAFYNFPYKEFINGRVLHQFEVSRRNKAAASSKQQQQLKRIEPPGTEIKRSSKQPNGQTSIFTPSKDKSEPPGRQDKQVLPGHFFYQRRWPFGQGRWPFYHQVTQPWPNVWIWTTDSIFYHFSCKKFINGRAQEKETSSHMLVSKTNSFSRVARSLDFEHGQQFLPFLV